MRSQFLNTSSALLDFSNGKYESFHLEREGLDIKVVSDGISDRNKEIQSHAKEAGLENILKMQALRYGSVDNAIKRNEEKKVFADVSKIPDSVGEQAEMVFKNKKDFEALCQELGLTKDQLLALTPEKYLEIKQAQAAALAAQKEQGGAE